jgi:hypothetical protein
MNPRESYLLGEPATVIAYIENCTKETMSLRPFLAPTYGFLSIWVRSPSASADRMLHTPVRREGRGIPSQALAPGRRITAAVPIYFSRDSWVLAEPGQYEVRAEYAFKDTSLRAEPMRVVIRAPEGKSDLIAAERFMKPQNALAFVLGYRDNAHSTAPELESIATQHAGTPWAGYAKLAVALGRYKGAPAAEASGGCRNLEKEVEQALEWFRDPIFAAEGLAAAAECLTRAQRTDAARSAQSAYFDRYPEARDKPVLADWVRQRFATGGDDADAHGGVSR